MVARIHAPATLTPQTLERLMAEFHAANTVDDSRVILLHGSAETFCAGADLGAVAGAGGVGKDAQLFADLLQTMVTSRKPVICEVRGRASAGGVGLAAAADLLVAADAAEFSLTEMLFGVVPAIVAPVLLRRISAARLMLWAMSSQTWTGGDAAAAGLVDVCVPAASLDATTRAWARRLQRTDRAAIGLLKDHVNRASPLTPADGVPLTVARLQDRSVLQRIGAFVEHGEAPWKTE